MTTHWTEDAEQQADDLIIASISSGRPIAIPLDRAVCEALLDRSARSFEDGSIGVVTYRGSFGDRLWAIRVYAP